ncbi:MAG: elongation factor G [Phycisphaerales bacterium]|nr:elongation factor G [Phycisphaerales bacterium]
MHRPIGDFRNVALVGHAHAGKTTLGEAILLKAGVTTRLGSVDDGTSVLDNNDESKERKTSVESSAFFVEHAGKVINVIDTPGAPDFTGQTLAALAGVGTAVVVVSAAAGIGVNTRRVFNAARKNGLAQIVAITRIDAGGDAVREALEAVQETFGSECLPINLPADGGKRVIDVLESEEGAADLLDVAECHKALVEAIVETDDALMTEYMETGAITLDRLRPAIGKAVLSGHVVPVVFVSSKGDVGVTELMDALTTFAPSPEIGTPRKLITPDNPEGAPIKPSAEGEFIAQVIKVMFDPKSNIRYALMRVHSGHAKADASIYTVSDRKGQRPGHFLRICADKHTEVEEASAGDIIAVAKLDLKIGDVVMSHAHEATIPMPRFPTPMFALALEPKSRGDIEKVSAALHRFSDEDPCFNYHRDPETHELLMEGMGDMHLTVIQSKMKRYFKLEVDTHAPKIPYRETIAGRAENVEYTHKKQSGGAGQFARVFINVEPNERGAGYEFVDKIFGGAIDQQFRPSVDKGIRQQMTKGVIAGYPVVDVKVSLVDGKTHPVDSKDIAFQIAGRQAFKKAFAAAKAILLEPVVHIEVTAPADNVGDITRDIAGKRGHIEGQDMLPGNMVIIKGTVPLAEVASYSSQLKSVTGGQGSYTMELSHYDVVPPNVQQQIMAAHKPQDEED